MYGAAEGKNLQNVKNYNPLDPLKGPNPLLTPFKIQEGFGEGREPLSEPQGGFGGVQPPPNRPRLT